VNLRDPHQRVDMLSVPVLSLNHSLKKSSRFLALLHQFSDLAIMRRNRPPNEPHPLLIRHWLLKH